MPLSSYALDTFVATKLSEFTDADIKDVSHLSDERAHWVNNFILGTTLRVTFQYPYRQHAFTLLRRAESTFREYELARTQTVRYLREDRAPSRYFLALNHWENVLSGGYMTFGSLQKFAKLGANGLFKKNDQSVLQRLNMLYNLTKHANDLQYPPDATLAVWLDNSGICSLEGRLDYDEISGEILPLIATLADQVQNPGNFIEDARPAATP